MTNFTHLEINLKQKLNGLVRSVDDILNILDGIEFSDIIGNDTPSRKNFLSLTMCLQIIGEDIKWIKNKLPDAFDDIPIEEDYLISARNFISHEYKKLDDKAEDIWDA